MDNVRLLANKMDELTALARSQKAFHECGIMCFTETWLHQDKPDHNVSIKGFQTVCADRDCTENSQRKVGGLAVLVNNRWCNAGHVKNKECICSSELFVVGLLPYCFFSRKLSHAIVAAVYISP